ncbi:nuclear transport factor 2 family protein [Streptomyces sp. NBC_01622]|uniref:nuclear transport factor 2 family protein n=1 Tax=Streptomyces sp. NBC_01622 TaxID=2975903 RepID=UPI003864A943|nr:nuclear transport factor 2 family protein [Streptomyces sp. NBC_01622]
MSTFLDDLQKAISAHDLEALVSCFTEDYRCDTPTHPARSFVGQEVVRSNWAGLFARVPDIEARVLRAVEDGDIIWSEWEMSGTTVDGTPQLMRGVVIVRTEGDRASQANFYLDPVD